MNETYTPSQTFFHYMTNNVCKYLTFLHTPHSFIQHLFNIADSLQTE
jgi:hypothetical protein